MELVNFIFYFTEDLESQSNKYLLASLFDVILKQDEANITIYGFFSENSIYCLLQLPLYLLQAIQHGRIHLFINNSQAKALLGPLYPQITWLLENQCAFLNTNEFFSKYSEFGALKATRLLKF